MKHLTTISLTLVVLLVGIFAVGHGYALFTDLVTAKDNTFYSGTYDIQISTTDTNDDSIADIGLTNWLDMVANVWQTPQQWTPGKIFSSRVFIRNSGDIDAEKLLWTLTQKSFSGVAQFDQVINLIGAWYDRNASGVQDPGEDIAAALDAAYNTNGGALTLRELFDGTNPVGGGIAFDLESGVAVLPSGNTNPVIGGSTGTGKGLFLIWQFDANADSSYQNSWVKLDFEFVGEQKTS